MSVLHFGLNAEVTIPDEKLLAAFGTVSAHVVDDVSRAVRDALKSPDGYPDLASATIPEDQVAIVLEPGLPRAADIVAGIVNELLAAQIEPERIVLVRSKIDASHSQASPLRKLPDVIKGSIDCVVHDPSDREMLSYLGPSTRGEALIYVNRQIAEADVVIPVGMGSHHELLGNLGVLGIVVPFFCDEETLSRFLTPKSFLSESEYEKRRAEAREIAWMLGTRLTVQVVTGDGNSVDRVLAGDAEVVEGRSREVCDALWRVTVPQRADLVVAGMSGERSQQTWSNLARTVRTAMQVVEPDGTIAICTELSSRPGTALQKVIGADTLDLAARAIKKDYSSDALAASELVSALQNAKIYLLSNLEEQIVEDLGLGYISSTDEVARLVNRHKSCVVISNAQSVVASVANS